MRYRTLVAAAFIAILATPLLAEPPTISKETTFITEPLTEDGWPDYFTALDRMLGEGVTPENNVAVPIWRAFGPSRVEPEHRETFFKGLGIPVPPEDENYIVMPAALEGELDDIEALVASFEEARHRPWTVKQYPKLGAWIGKVSGQLDRITEGCRRSHWYEPMLRDGFPALVNAARPGIAVRSDLRNILEVRAMFHLGRSAPEAAMQDLLALHRLARLSARGSGIEYLIGLSIDAAAYRCGVVLAGNGSVSAEMLRKYAAELRALPPPPHPAAIFDIEERFLVLDSLCAVASDPGAFSEELAEDVPASTNWRTWNWSDALRRANTWSDRLVEALRKETSSQRREALEKVDLAMKKRGRQLKNPGFLVALMLNPQATVQIVGFSISKFTIAIASKINEQTEVMNLYHSMIQAVFTLAIHRAETGSLPEKLEEVLDPITLDTFSGKPLTYKRTDEGFVLRSVGPDGEMAPDDADEDETDDIVFRVGGGK